MPVSHDIKNEDLVESSNIWNEELSSKKIDLLNEKRKEKKKDNLEKSDAPGGFFTRCINAFFLIETSLIKEKVSFWSLFRIKWIFFLVLTHFFFTTLTTCLKLYITTSISEILNKDLVKDIYKIIPNLFKKSLFSLFKLQKIGNFVSFFICLTLLLSLFNYLDNFFEEFLVIKIKSLISNLLFRKFRNINILNRQLKKDDLNTILKSDVNEFSYFWEHLYNHSYHNLISIIISSFGIFREGNFKQKYIEFSIFIFFTSIISFFNLFFTIKIAKEKEKFKSVLIKESKIINDEINNATLIDNMGLFISYEKQQLDINDKVENLSFYLSKLENLNKILSGFLTISFPFTLMYFNNELNLSYLYSFWTILDSVQEIISCFWDYSKYASSKNLINNFFSLPERRNGSVLIDTDSEISSIEIKKADFFYSPSLDKKTEILRKYSRIFLPGKINILKGKNGEGKSTIMQLLLGSLSLWEGEVLIKLKKGNIYDIEELDKIKWRENNIVYCSNNNLLEENFGSAGQKQWENISDIFIRRKKSQIWLFDEPTNCLDAERKKMLKSKVKDLVDEGKIVVYVSHAENDNE